MKFRALVCGVLALLTVSASFTGCAENDTDREDTDTAAGDETEQAEPEFPEADYGEEDFKFLYYGSTATDFADEYIYSSDITGSTIGDAVRDRNRAVEEMYNVVISAEECDPMTEARRRMQSGQCDFEVIYDWGSRSSSAVLEGILYDCNDLPNVNTDRSYWVPSAMEDLTVNDRAYLFINLISMNALSWADMTYFNKMIMDNLKLSYPYDYVYADNWTYDVYYDLVIGSEEDVNGDGIMDENDRFGNFGGPGLSTICYSPIAVPNGNGGFTYVGYTEGMVAAYNKYLPIVDAVASVGLETFGEGADGLRGEFGGSWHSAARYLIFGENHAMFFGGSIDMTKEFINMQEDYGVCPVPVMNPGDEYLSWVDGNAPLFSIPFQVEDTEMTGTVLDYLAYQSEVHLLPAYYDTTIKTKRMEDKRDYDMLDIIIDSTAYNWVGLYVGGTIGGVRGDMLVAGNFASVNRRYAAKCQEELDAFTEKLDLLP